MLLQTIPTDAPARQREREIETGRLVERAVRLRLGGASGSDFVVRRAGADVASLASSGARRALLRAVEALDGGVAGCGSLSGSLVSYGGVLERHREKAAAVAAYEAALAVRPEDPEVMLHAARAHRKAGNREQALALYGRVRERGEGRLARFSSLGEALLCAEPEEALTRVLSEVEPGDREVAAVALEERARVRRRASRWAAAVDDLIAAADFYDDRRDRLRVAHGLADLLLACGDMDAAREALAAALDLAVGDEQDHAVQRLRTVARAQGDELALRRWPPAGRSPLVSLMPPPRTTRGAASFAPRVQRWRDRL